MARAGNIAVERGDGAAALRGLVRQAKAVIADGRSILIFPEGTRVAVGDERPYQVRHGGALPATRRAGRAGRPELRPVLGTPPVHSSGLASSTSKILPAIAPGLSRDAS